MTAPFVEFQDPQPSFVRPIDSWVYTPTDHAAAARSYGPQSSRASSQPRSPYQHPARTQPAPSPLPVNIPTPSAAARGVTEVNDDGDFDLEDIDVDRDEFEEAENWNYPQGAGRQATRPRRRFVGGFVSNLRKLPRAVARNFVHERRPHPTIDQFPYSPEHATTSYALPHITDETVPAYSPSEAPVDSSTHYAQAVDMSQATLSPLPQTRPLDRLQRTHSGDASYSQHSTQSISVKSSVRSGRPSRISLPPTVRNPDPESPSPSEGSLTETNHPAAPVMSMPTPQVPQDDGMEPGLSDSYIAPPPTHPLPVHIDSGSPVYHEPPLAADYGRMESPVQPPEEPPLPTQLARLGRFFQTLNELPWFASMIAADFVPEESRRARRKDATSTSWYTPKRHNVDLLGGGSSSRVLLEPNERAAPHASSGTLPAYAQASRASVDNLRAQPPIATAYPAQYPYAIPPLPPPAPLYLYPSSVAQAAGASETRPQPAYPLYLVAVPSPGSYVSSELAPRSPPPPHIRIHSP